MSELDGTSYTDNVISPSDGARLATIFPDGSVDYYHTGAVGTTRAITDENGNSIANCGQNADFPDASFLTYSPFGAEVGGCAQTAVPYKFTGTYRDSESALDDFGARYYQSSLGRFLSPDPQGGDIYNPQSLNRYAYSWDNPATMSDPSGMYVCADSTKGHDCTSAAEGEWPASLKLRRPPQAPRGTRGGCRGSRRQRHRRGSAHWRECAKRRCLRRGGRRRG